MLVNSKFHKEVHFYRAVLQYFRLLYDSRVLEERQDLGDGRTHETARTAAARGEHHALSASSIIENQGIRVQPNHKVGWNSDTI